MKICVWADYTWCEEQDVEQYNWKSDDYMILAVPDDVEDIDAWVEETKPQG